METEHRYELDLSGADLKHRQLAYYDLHRANLADADLTGSDLQHANLNGANLAGAKFSRCRIYGISTWGVVGEPTAQESLFITPMSDYLQPDVGDSAPSVVSADNYWDFKHWATGMTTEVEKIRTEEADALAVDDLEVAYLVYLFLDRPNFRRFIDNVTSHTVLILGRFTEPRMQVLQSMREAFRKHGYVPIIFDFEKPTRRDLTETILLLAGLARFVVADITDAKSLPQELQAIVPNLPSVPIVPVLESGSKEYGMFEHFKRYPWVLQVHSYEAGGTFADAMAEQVIKRAEMN